VERLDAEAARVGGDRPEAEEDRLDPDERRARWRRAATKIGMLTRS
jgi:hypothetical protein